MNAQSILKYVLLGFVAVAFLVMAAREFDEKTDASSSAVDPLPADGLVAIYFHGNIRCPTCQTIEAYAQEAVDTNFAEELTAGKLTWQVLNYEATENAHFVSEYEIAAPTVVLVKRAAGRDAQWQNLSRVWEFVGDKPAFVDYIAAETKSLLSVH
jgi:hypothetical protein